MLSFQVVSGGKCWFIVRCYLDPDNFYIIKRVIADICQRPHGAALLVAGKFNNNPAALERNIRKKEIVAAIATTRLEDMPVHFLTFRKSWERGGRTWCMRFQGREVRSQMDYLLVTDHHIFWNISI